MSRDLFDSYTKTFETRRETVLTIQEYLEGCKKDPLMYAGPHERLLAAIGEPETVDTRNQPALSRIFANKIIKIYPAFREFYGTEEVIEQVVSYFRHAAQGLRCKFNLIPFNPFKESGLLRSDDATVAKFADVLIQAGFVTTVRKTRGDDIDAACGQLAGDVKDRTDVASRIAQQRAVPVQWVSKPISPKTDLS